jgi:hypothetical protein
MADRKRQKRRGSAPRPEQTSGPHHVADEPVGKAGALNATIRSPTTKSGLPVEDQIRKEWDPKIKGGLSTSLRTGSR